MGRADRGAGCLRLGSGGDDPGLDPAAIVGVEAPPWSETIATIGDIEFLAFPRLIAIPEVGWSRQHQRRWDGFRLRLAGHASRLTALGVNFYRSPTVPWP